MTSGNGSHTHLRTRLAALPTGLKMLILLSLALLPLGLVAIVSSIQAADGARESRNSGARLLAEASARQLTDAIDRTEISLRAATTAFPSVHPASDAGCMLTLDALAAIEDYEVQYAIIDDIHDANCVSEGFMPPPIPVLPAEQAAAVSLNAEDGSVMLVVSGPMQHPIGMAVLPPETVRALSEPAELIDQFSISLIQDDAEHVVHPWRSEVDERNVDQLHEAVADGQLTLVMAYNAVPLRPAERLSVALPILMWLAAAVLGWIAVGRLLLTPLSHLRRAVIEHGAYGGDFELSDDPISAIEIRDLGRAFDEAVVQLRDNEVKLAAGLTEQTRLTREVHHRVKNNLQIVASLLSLHARSAKSEDSAAAYASIQRRVDALAIVQRNLFAELDKAEGLPIRPVLAELASGLQQSAPPDTRIAITLDVAAIRVGQDIAAPVAFLVTELVELAMLCEKNVDIAIAVTTLSEDCAQLCLIAPALETASIRPESVRYQRVTEGLARQLRSALHETEKGTRFCIEIPYL
ncbi:sensor histidine kinase [Parasphingopyxis marina]|uniref:histidine kinase n=1 Tax=Parasphingopyxis marina TaxID=2761622 RepID=A0A842HXB9_9SPHN|nr:sensor histidine kinase [Parasphingopyxis marina]MBC2776981.1 sensor histidine kinase [Parasphingopyxis marina]